MSDKNTNPDEVIVVESENGRNYGELFPGDFTELFDDDSDEDTRFDRDMK